MKKKPLVKKEKQEEMIARLLDKALADHKSSTITNCSFVGVKYDEAATQTVTLIAEGLIENAKALGILARVMNASEVKIDTVLSV